jgi:hypothetical protein
MGETIRLDRVFLFRNQISFLIPHDWVEGDGQDDFYLYHAPKPILDGFASLLPHSN